MLLIHPNNINLIHKGMARLRVNDKCLVLVNTYGNSPIILFNKISENTEINISLLPNLLGPINVLNSLWSVLIIVFHSQFIRDGINHIVDGKINKIIVVLVQFSDQKFVLGSNVENRFVIIFNLCIYLIFLVLMLLGYLLN